LIPRQFASIGDRDAFFAARIGEVRRESEAAARKVQNECARELEDSCKATIRAIEAERDAQIRALAIKKTTVRVAAK